MKKLVTRTALVLLLAFGPLVAYNYVFDRYSILSRGFVEQYPLEPNARYLKVKFILENRDRFDSFIFGSSKAGLIYTSKIKGPRYYNFSYSQGVPGEWLYDLDFLIKKDIEIENVILAVDEVSYRYDPKKHMERIDRRHYTDNMLDKMTYYGKLLFLKPQLIDFIYFFKNRKKIAVNLDIMNDGQTYAPLFDERIAENPKEYYSSPVFRARHILNPGNVKRIDETIAEIKEFRDLCIKNDINLTVIFNPNHKDRLLYVNIEELSLFMEKLAGLVDYYDFSGLHSISTNDYMFYDIAHFKPVVGDMIMKKALNADLPVGVPKDFGSYVTKDNVDTHLNRQFAAIKQYQLKNRPK